MATAQFGTEHECYVEDYADHINNNFELVPAHTLKVYNLHPNNWENCRIAAKWSIADILDGNAASMFHSDVFHSDLYNYFHTGAKGDNYEKCQVKPDLTIPREDMKKYYTRYVDVELVSSIMSINIHFSWFKPLIAKVASGTLSNLDGKLEGLNAIPVAVDDGLCDFHVHIGLPRNQIQPNLGRICANFYKVSNKGWLNIHPSNSAHLFYLPQLQYEEVFDKIMPPDHSYDGAFIRSNRDWADKYLTVNDKVLALSEMGLGDLAYNFCPDRYNPQLFIIQWLYSSDY